MVEWSTLRPVTILSVPYLTGVPLQPINAGWLKEGYVSFSSLSNGSTSSTADALLPTATFVVFQFPI